MSDEALRIGGLTRLSTCDWPGEIVATIFCQGCPWRCGYCHNPGLIPARTPGAVDWNEVLSFLGRRRGLLDGVVFSGGEPTLQAALPAAMAQVRRLGFRVGLHTAGPYPERLSAVLPLCDWVGFDIKARRGGYGKITGAPGSGPRAYESLRRLLASQVDHEVRTTAHSEQLDAAELDRLAGDLADLGVRRYVVQAFRATGCLDDGLLLASSAPPQLSAKAAARFEHFTIRTA